MDPSAASITAGLARFSGIGLLGVRPRVFIFRKCAAPAVGEIEDRHVDDEEGVVSGCASSKRSRNLFLKLFSLCLAFMVISISLMLIGWRPVTTLQWRD